MDVPHPVPAHVVREDALAADEAIVLLARDALADERAHVDGCDGAPVLGRAHESDSGLFIYVNARSDA
jgi:hypothetical protein